MAINLSGDEKRTRMFKLSDSDYTSEEFLFIAFSILESKGFHNLIEIMSIVEDPDKIMKIIYLLNGVDLKLPTGTELAKALKTSVYVYMDTIKNRNITIGENRYMRPVFIRNAMGIDEIEEQELLKEYQEWMDFMHKNGYSIDSYLPIVSKKAKEMVRKVKKIKKAKRTYKKRVKV